MIESPLRAVELSRISSTSKVDAGVVFLECRVGLKGVRWREMVVQR